MRDDEDPRRDADAVSLGRLERNEGVFSFVHEGREVGCEPAEEGCVREEQDEAYDDDPVGGGPDDLPYSLGEERPDPIDARLPDGRPIPLEEVLHPSPAGRDEDGADERELWDRMEILSDQDETIGSDLAGVSEDDARRILDAMGDDAAEVLPSAPEGVSATGASSADFRDEEAEDEE